MSVPGEKTTELPVGSNPTKDDLLMLVNAPGTMPANQKMTLEDMFKVLLDLTPESAINDADLIVIIDDPAGTPLVRAMTRADFIAGVARLAAAQTFADFNTFTKGTRNTKSTLTYGASVTVDFDASEVQVVTLAGNITFNDSSNRGDTRHKTIFIIGDGSERTLGFNASWKIANKPTTLAANAQAVLTLTCLGSAETDVKGAYAVLE